MVVARRVRRRDAPHTAGAARSYTVGLSYLELPVIVTISPREAAELLHELLLDYQAELLDDGRDPSISILPADTERRGTVIYRVIQASQTVAEEFPDAAMFLITEDRSRWRLPPPPLDRDANGDAQPAQS